MGAISKSPVWLSGFQLAGHFTFNVDGAVRVKPASAGIGRSFSNGKGDYLEVFLLPGGY